MWPESQLTHDIAMFTTWKERFEKDYPQYKIVPATYTYSVDTIHSKLSLIPYQLFSKHGLPNLKC